MCQDTCLACIRQNVARKGRLKGRATAQGTAAYWAALQSVFDLPSAPQPVAGLGNLTLSSMGTGTYLGDLDSATDEAMITALLFTITHAWNVIDTASNYRWGMSEAAVGRALTALLAGSEVTDFAKPAPVRSFTSYMGIQDTARYGSQVAPQAAWQGRTSQGSTWGQHADPDSQDAVRAEQAVTTHQGPDITRDMVVVCSKVGFTHPQLLQALMQSGEVYASEVVHAMHTLSPAYLTASVEASLDRLGLETIDMLYLHNAAEMHIPAVGHVDFMDRLLAAFVTLEELRGRGKVAWYGLATWDCLRVPPDHPLHVSLEHVVALAHKAGGAQHGFRAVQLPVSGARPEAWLEPWQALRGRRVPLVDAAHGLGVAVVASSPLGGGKLVQDWAAPLSVVPELANQATPGGKLLQLARSAPGVTTTLVGHTSGLHVLDNVRLSFKHSLRHPQFVAAQKSLARELKRVGYTGQSRRQLTHGAQ